MASEIADDRFSQTMRELTRVQDELRGVPKADYARRQDLHDREDEPRVELRSLGAGWTDHFSIDQLKRRIADTERRIIDHFGNRLSHTSGAQTGYGGGLDPQILHWMHRAMDKAGELPAMKAELARLKDQLAKLEGH
jgi:hypothetical protein